MTHISHFTADSGSGLKGTQSPCIVLTLKSQRDGISDVSTERLNKHTQLWNISRFRCHQILNSAFCSKLNTAWKRSNDRTDLKKPFSSNKDNDNNNTLNSSHYSARLLASQEYKVHLWVNNLLCKTEAEPIKPWMNLLTVKLTTHTVMQSYRMRIIHWIICTYTLFLVGTMIYFTFQDSLMNNKFKRTTIIWNIS